MNEIIKIGHQEGSWNLEKSFQACSTSRAESYLGLT